MKDYTFIAGPCVIETMDILETVAKELVRLNSKYGIDIIFKASFDKANRTSVSSYRGKGMYEGLQMLHQIKQKFGLKIITDIHESAQAAPVAEVADVLQIPAFLCRQSDLIIAAARTGKIVNIKKAQFLSGDDMQFPIEKVRSVLAEKLEHEMKGVSRESIDRYVDEHVWLTERGNMYGYNNLVVDFRNIPTMKQYVSTVIMDCTHSVQRPGAAGGKTGGNREFVPAMAYAAKAFGATGYFFEVHPHPDEALSDAANTLSLYDLDEVIRNILA